MSELILTRGNIRVYKEDRGLCVVHRAVLVMALGETQPLFYRSDYPHEVTNQTLSLWLDREISLSLTRHSSREQQLLAHVRKVRDEAVRLAASLGNDDIWLVPGPLD